MDFSFIILLIEEDGSISDSAFATTLPAATEIRDNMERDLAEEDPEGAEVKIFSLTEVDV